jgi:rare lipoprotein A (peptidoglycan hydrolase)
MKDQYQSAYCGRMIQIKDTDNGKTITAKVQDTCPGCDENHVDLSIGAWNKLTNSAAWGVANIEWYATSLPWNALATPILIRTLGTSAT